MPAPASARPDGVGHPQGSSEDEVAAFLQKMKSVGPLATGERGRLIFAMDATMSRAPTWDMALAHQADMFAAVKSVGGLDVQLVYFRGFGECRASKWVSDPDTLARLMSTVTCQGGQTQIGKVLSHARSEADRHRVGAMVYVGDCVEEDIDRLATKAGELKLVGIPVFLFQEGPDRNASIAFQEIARITGGAHCRFDQGAAGQLHELLTAVAIYAAGGRRALAALADGRGSDGARRLLAALPPPPERRG
ncbi:MAG: vWA domain-containing protein [Hyphomicrobiaceae bacterium]